MYKPINIHLNCLIKHVTKRKDISSMLETWWHAFFKTLFWILSIPVSRTRRPSWPVSTPWGVPIGQPPTHLQGAVMGVALTGLATNTNIYSLCFLWKIIDLPGGQIIDTLTGLNCSFLLLTAANYLYRAFGGLFELTCRPFRALNIALHIASRTYERQGPRR